MRLTTLSVTAKPATVTDLAVFDFLGASCMKAFRKTFQHTERFCTLPHHGSSVILCAKWRRIAFGQA
jgi:hypothetical protein